MKQAIIIGAGPAGLTAGIELLTTTDIKPIILETHDYVGGISASIHHNGNRMDLGGHRFFSKSDLIMDWWMRRMPIASLEEAEDNDKVMLLRNRVSRIFYLRKFFDYPISLRLQTFLNMGIRRSVIAGIGYLGAQLRKRPEENLEDFMINRFGKPLYRMFFEDYTTKVWGIHPREISPEWGAQRIRGLSLMAAFKNAFRRIFLKKMDVRQKNVETSLIERFLYPKYGPGQFWELVAEEIKQQGGEIHLLESVKEVRISDNQITHIVSTDSEGREMIREADVVLSSMPIKDLVTMTAGTDIPPSVLKTAEGLPYRDFITVGLLVNKLTLRDYKNRSGAHIPDCWIYIQEPDVKIGRLQIFNNWSPFMVKNPSDTMWIGLEYFCDEGDELWDMQDDEFIRMAAAELQKLGIIGLDDILDSVRIRVKKAYPSYFGTYKDFHLLREWLGKIPNLYCIGRNGQHRYNNMDHSMLTAMEAVNIISSGSTDKDSLWCINTDEVYHEQKAN